MGFFDHFKRKEKPIRFSDELLDAFSNHTDQLCDTLNTSGIYIDLLSQIKDAALRRDQEMFKKLVVNEKLFGGSGAIWEIAFDDKLLQEKFNSQFRDYIDLLKMMGIRNGRIDQVRRGFQ